MRAIPWIAMLATLTAIVAAADAADHVLQNATIGISRSASGNKEKLVFMAKDPGFLFPSLGSADDPGTGTPGGAVLDVATRAHPDPFTFTVPAGVGRPGWRAQDRALDSFVYGEPGSPLPLHVKTLSLKQGRVIKIVASSAVLAFDGPQAAIGVRLTTGSLRNCAYFDGATIRKDVPTRLTATVRGASSLVDCSVLVPPAPTTTSSTVTTTTSTTSTTVVFPPCTGGSPYPSCGGTCDGDAVCRPTLDIFTAPTSESCACYPPDVTPCAAAGYPTCGGACGNGGVCAPMKDFATPADVCVCVDPAVPCPSEFGPPGVCLHLGSCPAGKVCGFAGVDCGCVDP
jgi:hypothetical protein